MESKIQHLGSARINHCNHQTKVVAVGDHNRGNIRPSLKLKYDFRVNRKITNDPSCPLLLLSETISYLRNLIQRMQDQELTTIVSFKISESIHHSSPLKDCIVFFTNHFNMH